MNRTYLWQKLLSNNIDGKMFKIIHSLYANAKSAVRIGNLKSGSFTVILESGKAKICPLYSSHNS